MIFIEFGLGALMMICFISIAIFVIMGTWYGIKGIWQEIKNLK